MEFTVSSSVGGCDLFLDHILTCVSRSYNIHYGILHRGDGSNVNLAQLGNSIVSVKPFIGTGNARNLAFSENSVATETNLLNPLALASAPDGSVYIGDYNFIRQVDSKGEVRNVLELSPQDLSSRYYLAVSPTDGSLYVSLSARLQVLKIKSLPQSQQIAVNKLDMKQNFVIVAGNGQPCLPVGDSWAGYEPNSAENCGDGELAINAQLTFPKGISVDQTGGLYIADGSALKYIDYDTGVITTLIAQRAWSSHFRPSNWGCDVFEKSSDHADLYWPTALAVNPLDDYVNVLDGSKILRLAKERNVVELVAGREIVCVSGQINITDESDRKIRQPLRSAESIGFNRDGDLFILDVQPNSWQLLQTKAGQESDLKVYMKGCSCAEGERFARCECVSKQSDVKRPKEIGITPDGTVLLADPESRKVREYCGIFV